MTDILITKKNLVLDATTLSALMNCARLTEFQYKLNLRQSTGKSNSLEVGTLAHTILEHFYKSIIQGLKREQAIGIGMIAGELVVRGCQHCTDWTDTENSPPCGHKPNEFPGLKNTPMDSTSKPNRVGWKHVFDTMEQYFAFYRNDSWVPLFAEEVRGDILYEDDDIRILWKAKLDLGVDTNQGIFPVDHKTMSQRRETNSMNNQFIGQCLIMKTRNVVINKIGWQTTLKPEEKFTRAVLSYSADRLMEWQSEILPFYAYQLLTFEEAGYYPPRFDHCEGKYGPCPFLNVCEADRNMREEELRLNFTKVEEWNPKND